MLSQKRRNPLLLRPPLRGRQAGQEEERGQEEQEGQEGQERQEGQEEGLGVRPVQELLPRKSGTHTFQRSRADVKHQGK
jgi:hypothetical protein